MRVVIQKVKKASVHVSGELQGNIAKGLLVFVGIEDTDTQADITWLCNKIVGMRLFADAKGVLNYSVKQVGAEILVVSQFTLFASTKKGNRPSYSGAAKAEIATPLYQDFLKTMAQALEKPIASGVFGADMQVGLVNDGPVTITMDSRNKY